MNFEFAGPRRLVFAAGGLQEVGSLARKMGSRALVVTGKNSARAEPLRQLLARVGVATEVFSIPNEPTTDAVREGTVAAKKLSAEVLIGFGGGSAMDAAKAIAILATHSGEPMDYLEIVGAGKSFSNPSLPVIAIPTTAGTGSEATRNAVLSVPEHGLKASLRSPLMLPAIALVDPELTWDLPPQVTATTGMDALTQLIEPFICSRANPIVDAFCRDGIPRVVRSLRRAFQDGKDAAAREDMALASLLGGLSLANAGLGVVHGFAAPIGGMFAAPHGSVCAALLPHAFRANTQALIERQSDHPALARFQEISRMLTGNPSATMDDAVLWLTQLKNELRIPALRRFGIRDAEIPEIVQKAKASSSIRANPLPLTDEELTLVLKAAL